MSSIDTETLQSLTRLLWDYNRLGQGPRSADVLIVMGTNDIRVAEYGAVLDRAFTYGHIIVTGGVSHARSLTGTPFGGTEAEVFHRILIDHGVRADKILVENQARNTGANIIFTRELLSGAGIVIASAHMVHTPAMERRSLATALCQWPGIDWSVSSPDIPFEAYEESVDAVALANDIIGDTFRVLKYPERGFQIEQDMPEAVRAALAKLIELGFTKRIPSDYKVVLDQA